MRFSFYTILLTFSTLLFGCTTRPNVSDLTEEIEVKDSSGAVRKASYFDKKSHEKLLEREYYPDQKTFKEWPYKSGFKNGEARSYRENGTLWSLNTYKNDALDGPYKTFHENGALYIEGQYFMGNKGGIWKFFSPDGKLVRTYDFATTDSTNVGE